MANSEQTTGRRYRGVSKEDRQEERRHKFILAGLEVFGHKGYHASTVRSICQAAGVTERYFYESFANSEDLLCATYQHVIAEVQEQVLAATREALHEPEVMSKAALAAFFAYVKANPPGARIAFIEILGVSPRVDQLYRTSTESFAALLVLIARSLYQDKIARTEYSEEWMAAGLVGAVITITHRWVLEDFKSPEEVVVNNAYGIFRAVVRHWLDVAMD